MRRLYCIGLLAMACTNDGGDESTEGATTGGTTAVTATGGTNETNETNPTAGTMGTADGSSGGSGGTMSATPGDCRTLLEQDPATPDGVYTFNAGGDPAGATFEAYCDMTTAGGGWTLVGRSAPGEWDGVPFGWQQASGNVNNDGSPYSLDALAAELEFSQLLLGSYTDGKTWGPDLYTVDAPEHFVFVYGRSPFPVIATTVAGECMPEEGPHHLRHIGWTELSSIFHIADVSYVDYDGLGRSGWDTDHSDCEGGGNLDETQGMIMVR